MMLFDPSKIDPNQIRFQEHDEPEFQFLQSSSRPIEQRVRELLESWFAEYPKEHQNELRQRMVTSKSDIDSPVFEIVLHTILKSLGAQVEVHPQVSHKIEKRPDFLVTLPSGYQFFLEAVLARGQSDEQRSLEMIERQIFRVIDQKLKSPKFFCRSR